MIKRHNDHDNAPADVNAANSFHIQGLKGSWTEIAHQPFRCKDAQ